MNQTDTSESESEKDDNRQTDKLDGKQEPYAALNFFLAPTQIQYKRSIYTALDFLGDVGGLLDGLRLVGNIIMAGYTLTFGNPLNAFLMNSLFKRGKVKKRKRRQQSLFETIRNRSYFKIRSCACLRDKKEKRMFEKALGRSEGLLEIDEILKT